MENSVENNLRLWDRDHPWSQDGDEWDGQARRCGQPYDRWKQSVVDQFLRPNLEADGVVLEIGPGHGRWSRRMVEHCRELILVDLSPTCLEYCRRRLSYHPHVRTLRTEGRSLDGIGADHVDFVWSFDAFVHMDRGVVRSYLAEIQRVLRPGGRAVLHHAGRRHVFLPLRFLRRSGRLGAAVYQGLTMGTLTGEDGWRSDVSRRLVRQYAAESALAVADQTSRWGPRGEFGVPRFRDAVTTLRKPGGIRTPAAGLR